METEQTKPQTNENDHDYLGLSNMELPEMDLDQFNIDHDLYKRWGS